MNRIQPSAFLVMKKEILTEYIRRKGKMSRRETRTLFKMDVNKVGKVFDLLDELFTLYKWDACVAGAIAWHRRTRSRRSPWGTS